MGVFQKIVEQGTDTKYVPRGKKCDICGEKLGFLETGFWSTNATQLVDGVICTGCRDKLKYLVEYRDFWIPKARKKEPPFSKLSSRKLHLLDKQGVATIMEAAEAFGREELSAVGPEYTAIFRMRDACFIQPTALQVGIVRAKRLYNKLVLFGFVQLGQFRKGDKVLILDGEYRREAAVLEAYAFDPDVPENDLEVMLKAHMGKQRLDHWQTGWLVLDDEETIGDHASVVG